MLVQMPRGSSDQPGSKSDNAQDAFEEALRRDLAEAHVVSYASVIGGSAKRVADFALVLILAPFWVPLLVLAFLVAKCLHRAPALVSEKRVGYGGRPFSCYRLQFAPPCAKIEHLFVPDEGERAMAEAAPKTQRQPGKWQLAFERLPRLFNVLRGDMALVGPPPLAQLAHLKSGKRYYLSCRPGVVGVSSAGEDAGAPYKAYIVSWSLAGDARILWNAFKAFGSHSKKTPDKKTPDKKNWKGVAASLLLAAIGLGGGLVWNADRAAATADGVRSHQHVSAQAAAAARAEQQAFTEIYLSRQAGELQLASGENLASLLKRAGASQDDAKAAVSSISAFYDPRQLRPGQAVSLDFDHANGAARLIGVAFDAQPGSSVSANLKSSGGFAARQVQMPLNLEVARISAPVDTGLYASALAHGATEHEIAELATAFGYDVDFQRDVRPGDHFELMFERYFDDGGQTVRTGDLLYIALDTRQGQKTLYAFRGPNDNSSDWYDADGHSARRSLMKTPVNGARLSSSFGVRINPVLGYSMMHRGADFAAPVGTPIMAAGEGVVERAGSFGAYGNYVRLRHDAVYETAYAHLSSFAPGVRPGTHVAQGQIIGYVGATGRSTGPHLHYEVLKDGSQINPMGLRLADGRDLRGADLALFQAERARIDGMRDRGVLQTAATTDAGPSERGARLGR